MGYTLLIKYHPISSAGPQPATNQKPLEEFRNFHTLRRAMDAITKLDMCEFFPDISQERQLSRHIEAVALFNTNSRLLLSVRQLSDYGNIGMSPGVYLFLNSSELKLNELNKSAGTSLSVADSVGPLDDHYLLKIKADALSTPNSIINRHYRPSERKVNPPSSSKRKL